MIPVPVVAWGFFVARPGGYEGRSEEDMAKDISERIAHREVPYQKDGTSMKLPMMMRAREIRQESKKASWSISVFMKTE